jgi:hypothetical protein
MVKRIIDYDLESSAAGDDYVTFWDTSEAKQKRIAVNNVAFTPTKSVDANGWTVYDYGVFKEYMYYSAVNDTVNNGQRAVALNVPPPSGVSWSQLTLISGYSGNYSGHAVTGVEVNGSNLDCYIGNQYSGGALNFTGTFGIIGKVR